MLSELKVLIIDDDEDDYFITSQYLQEIESFNVSCDWCYNIKDAQQRLVSNAYDLYFLDYRLGARTGLELLRDAKQNGATRPVILLTGKGTVEIDKQAVENGAYDYLVKSELNSEKLERCLRYSMERYKSFKLLNDNERKYRLIFENALSFIFTCDKLLHFGDCNPACEYLCGYTPEELRGTSFLNLLDGPDKTLIFDQLQARRNIANAVVKLSTKQGVTKTGNLSLTWFEAGDIEPYWQGIIYDDTLRSQAEQEKIQSEKLEATYRLVRTLAHEIRNPLTNIGLSLEGITDQGIPDEQQAFVDIIRRSSDRINGIISELLNSSKTVELKPELVDLNELLSDVVSIAQDRIRLRNISANVVLAKMPALKLLDKEKFKIAILNLVVNAIEAMDKEEKQLYVGLSHSDDQTEITVRDNGSGMDEGQLRKLFEPYFTTKKTGMGLGLVSTLNIIKSHKAAIEVDSKPGVGTTFRVVFP